MKEVRTEDRIDEARLPEPKIPILDGSSSSEEVASDGDSSKSRCNPSNSSNSKNYREDVEMS